MDVSYSVIGIRVRHLRKKMRLTQDQLAELAGIARHTVSRIETGRKKPSVKSLTAIASAFGISLDELLHDSDKDEPLRQLLQLYKGSSAKERRLILAIVKAVLSVLHNHSYFL